MTIPSAPVPAPAVPTDEAFAAFGLALQRGGARAALGHHVPPYPNAG